MTKRILVTGGAGFIGSHVAEELFKRGNEVIVLDNFIGGSDNIKEFDKGIKVVEGDICDQEVCRQATKGIDAVFHIAAHAAEGQSVFIPIFNLRTNLLGSVTLLTEAINNGVKDFVFTSSIAAYGKPESLPVSESSALKPEDPYGVTKKAFEDYLRVYHELGQINPYIVRFFNVYGPRQRMDDPYRGVVPIFINRCLKKQPLIIFGDGLQKRAFTYISDIVEPICNIINHKNLIYNPINIGTEEVHTVKELAGMIVTKMKLSIKPVFEKARTSDVKVTYCDVAKAKELLGYKAKVSLDKGLDKTVEWAKKKGHQQFKYMELSEIEKLRHGVYKRKRL